MNLVTNTDYDTFGSKNKEVFSNLFGDTMFGQKTKNMYVHEKNSIGYRILNNLKSDEEGKHVEDLEKKRKRMVGPIIPYKEESFLNLTDIGSAKEDFQGLGYDPTADLGRNLEVNYLSWTIWRRHARRSLQQEDEEAIRSR